MQMPFRHAKHKNSSQFRKVYECRDHSDCSHCFTVIEGKNPDGIASYLCYQSGNHPVATSSSNTIINAPSRGIHPAIKLQIDQWVKDSNMKPAQVLFNLENSKFLNTHQLPTQKQISQYKSEINRVVGLDINTLSSFREYMNQYKVRFYIIYKIFLYI